MCQYYHLQILIHRPFITSRHSSTVSFPSLAICTNAARSLARIFKTLLARFPVQAFSCLIMPAFMSGVVLLLAIWDAKSSGMVLNPSKEIEQVEDCLHILETARERWHFASSLWYVPRPICFPRPGSHHLTARFCGTWLRQETSRFLSSLSRPVGNALARVRMTTTITAGLTCPSLTTHQACLPRLARRSIQLASTLPCPISIRCQCSPPNSDIYPPQTRSGAWTDAPLLRNSPMRPLQRHILHRRRKHNGQECSHRTLVSQTIYSHNLDRERRQGMRFLQQESHLLPTLSQTHRSTLKRSWTRFLLALSFPRPYRERRRYRQVLQSLKRPPVLRKGTPFVLCRFIPELTWFAG